MLCLERKRKKQTRRTHIYFRLCVNLSLRSHIDDGSVRPHLKSSLAHSKDAQALYLVVAKTTLSQFETDGTVILKNPSVIWE